METVFKGKSKVEIGRFKGLGEMLPAQLKETTMDPSKRTMLKVVVEEEAVTDTNDTVERLMGNKPKRASGSFRTTLNSLRILIFSRNSRYFDLYLFLKRLGGRIFLPALPI